VRFDAAHGKQIVCHAFFLAATQIFFPPDITPVSLDVAFAVR
jgi:hypothetical protein